MARGLTLIAGYDGDDDDVELASLALADALCTVVTMPRTSAEIAGEHLRGLARALSGRVL